MSSAARVECSKEFDGRWTVRVNGCFIYDSWFERRARAVAMRIMEALASNA